MNQPRRKRLENISGKISELKDLLKEIRDEEDEYKENIPENLWGSERYEKAEEVVEQLEEADDFLDQVIGLIDEVVS